MKKYISVIIAAAMIISVTGCSSASDTALNSSSVTGGEAAANGGTVGSSAIGDTVSGSGFGTFAAAGEIAEDGGAAPETSGGAVTASSEGGEDRSVDTSAPETITDDTDDKKYDSTTTAATVGGAAEEIGGTGGSADSSYAGEYEAIDEGEAEETGFVDSEADFMPEFVYDAAADTAAGAFPFEGGAAGHDSAGIIAHEEFIEILPELPMPDIIIEEPEIPPQAGLLTGGEWNDNEHWNDWVSLYQTHEDWNTYRDIWRLTFDSRYEITVTSDGKPVEGAEVSVPEGMISRAVTDSKGKAYLFFSDSYSDTEHKLIVKYDGAELSQPVDMQGSRSIDIDIGSIQTNREKALDLMLMIDTTGSMDDELTYIQAELEDVITRVKNDNGNIPIRVSVNFYRDEYDDYVLREFPFTDSIDSALSDLRAQEASGGGDFPEAVHTALASAVRGHEWEEQSAKLMFLVLDAPPHEDRQIIDEVNSLVSDAAAEGIRIIPVASSGVDKSTEYLLRTMAFATGGTYTFLTNHSGIGNSHIEPTIGDYQVEKLNDMMVRIINGYLE